MKRNRHPLTAAQLEYRDRLLRGSLSTIKKHETPPPVISTLDEKISNQLYYLNNCIYWINEYLEGRQTKAHFLKTIRSMQYGAEKIETLLFTQTELK